MTRKTKRGYIEKAGNEYNCSISKVTQTDDFGGWTDEDEEEWKCFGGFKTVDECKDFLKSYKVKEIVVE